MSYSIGGGAGANTLTGVTITNAGSGYNNINTTLGAVQYGIGNGGGNAGAFGTSAKATGNAMTIWDQEFPCSEALIKSECFYQGMRCSSASSAMLFHLKVWKNLNPKITDFAVLRSVAGISVTNTLFVFASKQSQAQFKDWWSDYTRRFDETSWENNCLPVPLTNVRGTLIPFESDNQTADSYELNLPTSKLTDAWIWIVNHCLGKVWRISHEFWLFESEREAVAFKLKWC